MFINEWVCHYFERYECHVNLHEKGKRHGFDIAKPLPYLYLTQTLSYVLLKRQILKEQFEESLQQLNVDSL